MAMRRPRIKAQANIQLNSKRKPKNAEVKPKTNESDNVSVVISPEVSEVNNEQAVKSLILPNKEEIQLQQQKQQEETCSTNDINNGKEVISGNNATDTSANKSENSIDQTKNSTNNAAESYVKSDEKAKKRGETVSVVSKNSLKTGNNHLSVEVLSDREPFKCPPKVEYQRSVSHNSNCGTDDVFYSDIEENAMQLETQGSSGCCPMSPTKNQMRQRIKPTPIFGQRRNSFVGSSPNPHASAGGDDVHYNNHENSGSTPRRERHISSSLSVISNSSVSSNQHHHHYHHSHTPHKYLPNGVSTAGMGRMRTESGCSVFSDNIIHSNYKSRKNEDHKISLKREFEARFVNGVPDKSCIKMSDLIYYNPVTNPMEQKQNPNVKHENNESNITSSEIKPFKEKKEKDTEDERVDESEAMPVPQLKLDSNGELILDDKSLVIETTAEQEARKVLANSSLIYLDENTGMNGFYSRQKRTRDWPAAETVKFYRCLQTVGTDFSIMVPLFPNRTRRDLKLKFKKEERINGNLINKALLYPKQFNIEDLKQQIEEEEKKREEEANRLKQLKEAAAKEVKKRKFVRSSADCTLNGRNVYHNEYEQKNKKPRNTTSTTKAKRSESAKQLNDAVEATLTQQNDVRNPKESTLTGANTKIKRRMKRLPNMVQNKKKDVFSVKPDTDEQPDQIIKVEIFKNEPLVPQTKLETIDYHNHHHNSDDNLMEVEVEIDELSHSNRIADSHSYNNINMQHLKTTVPINESPISSDSPTFVQGESYYTADTHHHVLDDDDANNDYESRTFVNLDDGSVTTVNNVMNNYEIPCPRTKEERQEIQRQQTQQTQLTVMTQPTPSPSPPSLHPLNMQHQYTDAVQLSPRPSVVAPPPPDLVNTDTCSSQMSERELNESDIQQILTELAEGSLFLVSTLHPDDPDKVLNEIFMVDKNTGVLCDEPLNIPDNIVQCILSVMS